MQMESQAHATPVEGGVDNTLQGRVQGGPGDPDHPARAEHTFFSFKYIPQDAWKPHFELIEFQNSVKIPYRMIGY
jgi:hypothetical protein